MNNLTLTSSAKILGAQARSFSILIIASLLLIGCGSGSKTPNKTNPNTNIGSGSGGAFTYKGEKQAASPDVIKFQNELWVNIATPDRCGGCHSDSTAKQSPMFARGDDINLAYDAVIANNLVSLANPGESRIVDKVGKGHHCWRKDAGACAEDIKTWITKWAGEAGTTTNAVVLKAPEVKDIGNTKAFPKDSSGFATTVYPLLTEYCSRCHSENALTKQQPYFASSDLAAAYEAAKTKMRLDSPKDSRFVLRLGTDFHNCWGDCAANAKTMLDAIQTFSDSLTPVTIDPALIVSKAVSLSDAFVLSSGGRVDTNLIAKYEFKTGKGTVAYDTSGISPVADLNLIGNVAWSSAWGIKIRDAGRAQATTASSRKLFDLINGSGEYSIETWIIPDNVTQGGNDNNPSRIVSYSGSDTLRNFTLGQYEYNYDFLNRTTKSDANGLSLTNGDAFHTKDTDQLAQATLQHVVVTFDPVNGRKIYVNGELTKDVDPDNSTTLKDWDSNFALVVGNEVTGNPTASNWSGNMRFLGVHKRAMSAADIAANYKVGVGAKYLLLFNISDLLDTDATKYSGSFIVFEVQQIDDYGYLFANPFFVNLDGKTVDSDIPVQGVRIGVNGEEAPVGQVFANLSTSLNSGRMNTAGETKGRQYLSSLGTVIAAKNGPDTDQFFITFDRIGIKGPYDRPIPSSPAIAEPAPIVGQPKIGLRRFAEINATLSVLTGVPTSNSAVYAVYQKVQQQLPTLANLDGFLAAQQMGITQLAVSYCNALVSDSSSRNNYFGASFPFTSPVATVFPVGSANRDLIINPLLNKLLANGVVTTQPTSEEIKVVLNALITNMGSCSGDACTNRTLTTIKATCSAAFGSAAMLLQ